MLTLLTATGARPEAWAICERLMAAQTYSHPVRWIVVDDGPVPQPVTFARDRWDIVVVRPEPVWQPGQNTQARNLLAGLALVESGESVVVIEDDDYYAPDWLDQVSAQLSRAEVVGEHSARYYNIARRVGRQLSNRTHASLCSTAVRGKGIDRLRAACRANPKFIDLHLWKTGGHLFGGHRVVGIKGLPGRGGIGMGHHKDMHGILDSGLKLLKGWIGEGVRHYG